MTYLLYTVLLATAFVFVSLSHPIGLGLLLIMHTLLISALTGLIGGSFWFSYILFLVFLGGVLVLFIYMTSLASNEKFSFSWVSLTMLLGATVLLLLGVWVYTSPSIGPGSTLADWGVVVPTLGLSELVMKLYSTESFKVTLLLILYLLYALLVCAKIVNSYAGALRNFN